MFTYSYILASLSLDFYQRKWNAFSSKIKNTHVTLSALLFLLFLICYLTCISYCPSSAPSVGQGCHLSTTCHRSDAKEVVDDEWGPLRSRVFSYSGPGTIDLGRNAETLRRFSFGTGPRPPKWRGGPVPSLIKGLFLPFDVQFASKTCNCSTISAPLKIRGHIRNYWTMLKTSEKGTHI